MIKSITIKNDTNLSEILIPNKFTFQNGVNLLFGSNGVGKTSLIRALLGEAFRGEFDTKIEGESPLVYRYINSRHNARELDKNTSLSYTDFFDPHIISRMYDAKELSEGQSIVYTIQEFLQCMENNSCDEERLFLVDEVDSGLSIDNIVWLCEEIKHIVLNKNNIQVVISFNNYEFCNHFESVIDMYTGEYISIKNYTEYKELLCKRRNDLMKRRNYNQFRDFYNK